MNLVFGVGYYIVVVVEIEIIYWEYYFYSFTGFGIVSVQEKLYWIFFRIFKDN